MTRLKQILTDEGRSQTWLARKVGVDRSVLNRYVNGLIPPEATQIAISDALGRTVDDVFSDRPTGTGEQAA